VAAAGVLDDVVECAKGVLPHPRVQAILGELRCAPQKGLPISGIAESAVNQVVSLRTAKKRQCAGHASGRTYWRWQGLQTATIACHRECLVDSRRIGVASRSQDDAIAIAT
jgi:hypothetical protein